MRLTSFFRRAEYRLLLSLVAGVLGYYLVTSASQGLYKVGAGVLVMSLGLAVSALVGRWPVKMLAVVLLVAEFALTYGVISCVMFCKG